MIIHRFLFALTTTGLAQRHRIPPDVEGIAQPWRHGMDCFTDILCTGYERKDRSACGTLEDPCPIRVAGSVGVSMFNFHHPFYGKRQTNRNYYECGRIYQVTLEGGVDFYGVISDFQAGYWDTHEVEINQHPDDYPWNWSPVSAFDWMDDHWNLKGHASEYLEIEPTAWNSFFAEEGNFVDPEDSCATPLGHVANARPEPVNYPKKSFTMEFSGHTDHRINRPNVSPGFLSRRFTDWNNYLRAIHEIPKFFANNATMMDWAAEHSTKRMAGFRTGGHTGATQRWANYKGDSGYQGEIVSGASYPDQGLEAVNAFVTSEPHYQSMLRAYNRQGPGYASRLGHQGINCVLQGSENLRKIKGHSRQFEPLVWWTDRFDWECKKWCPIDE